MEYAEYRAAMNILAESLDSHNARSLKIHIL